MAIAWVVTYAVAADILVPLFLTKFYPGDRDSSFAFRGEPTDLD
jgi:hypothetical protein